MDPLSRLAVSAAAGDPTAVTALVEAIYDDMWQLCATLVDRESAEDLAQEAIIKAVSALPSYRGDATARTWLLAIARYTCMDELRSRYRHPLHEPVADLLGGASGKADVDEDLIVSDLLSRLEPGRRTAFVLTQVLGLTYDEAARVCDCPTGTIRSRVARARADLLQAVNIRAEHEDSAKPESRLDSA